MTIDNKKPNNYVWHYTRACYLLPIEADGHLLPKSELEFAGKNPLLKGMYLSSVPLIWFSSDQNWEHSASQLANWRFKSWKETAFEISAMRYGISVDDSRLLNWNDTCELSGSNREERRQRKKLIPHARKTGSNPAMWFSCPDPIPLEDLCFQMWLNGEWSDVDRDEVRDNLLRLR
jgi:hypothetical protein